jgi:hypothetical protein
MKNRACGELIYKKPHNKITKMHVTMHMKQVILKS